MPLRVAITGVAGRLGAAISKALKKDARVEVVAGLDVSAGKEVTQTANLAAGGFFARFGREPTAPLPTVIPAHTGGTPLETP